MVLSSENITYFDRIDHVYTLLEAMSTSYLQKDKAREGSRLCEDLHVAKSQENIPTLLGKWEGYPAMPCPLSLIQIGQNWGYTSIYSSNRAGIWQGWAGTGNGAGFVVSDQAVWRSSCSQDVGDYDQKSADSLETWKSGIYKESEILQIQRFISSSTVPCKSSKHYFPFEKPYNYYSTSKSSFPFAQKAEQCKQHPKITNMKFNLGTILAATMTATVAAAPTSEGTKITTRG